MVCGLCVMVHGLWCGVQGLPAPCSGVDSAAAAAAAAAAAGLGFSDQGSGKRVQRLDFRGYGSAIRVQGIGFSDWGSGDRVQRLGFRG